MKYGNIDGPILFRFARTAPVINSSHALELGVRAELGYNPDLGQRVDVGRNVKIRMLLAGRTKRMTCHGKVAWIERDEATGRPMVGIHQLSLSDEEFGVLRECFTAEPVAQATLGDSVRLVPDGSEPVVTAFGVTSPITRQKALTLPVALIERIDAERGDTPFSEFVVVALNEHLDRS